MKWCLSRNNKPVPIKDIPVLSLLEFRKELLSQISSGKRLLAFFGQQKEEKVVLYAVIADDEFSKIFIASALFEPNTKSYLSLTPDLPCFHFFEREFFEDFGIYPQGHPWPKPVRFPSHNLNSSQEEMKYPFYSIHTEQLHEVAVGPIHAGVIEPGHFRFLCDGEQIQHLEIQLGYQHRGIEKLFEGKTKADNSLAESIAGDSLIAHTLCHVGAMESMASIQIPYQAEIIRAIALELERIAVHIGDLSAISNDVAYLLGSSVFGATRTLIINTLLEICGSRFGKSLIRFGGVGYSLTPDLRNIILSTLKKVEKDIDLMGETLFNTPSVLSRIEETGTVSLEQAKETGTVGLVARASGLTLDVRVDHPYGIYKYIPYTKYTLQSGDVFARTYLRYLEIQESIHFIKEELKNFPDKTGEIENQQNKNLAPESFVFSMVEGWRGEVSHCVITGKNGEIARYKIKDPSFNNWFALSLAVRKNGISDFPLCNKSFNLSYCGVDL